jgi:HK97 family phage major capsid protein
VSASEFKTWGEFLYEVWSAENPKMKGPPDSRLVYFKDDDPAGQVKDMSGQTSTSGGALIPVEFQATLMAAMATRSIVRSRATVIPMRRRQLEMPVLDQTGTTAGRPHWFGGLQFYWMEEGGDKTASDAQFRSLALVARKLIGFTRAADELLDDAAISLDAFLSGPMGFAGGAAWMEDYAFLRGTGAGQPLGVINSPAAISVTRQTAGTVTYDDLANMLEAFLPSGNGVWLASQSLMSDLVTMTGPSGNPSYLWNGVAGQSIAGRVPGTLLGYPIIWDEKIPRRGYSGDIGLYDLSYYLIGDRQSTTVESTKFEAWKEDKTSWRMVHRVDGRPWLSAPFTYEDGETQVSPFVKLTGNTAS